MQTSTHPAAGGTVQQEHKRASPGVSLLGMESGLCDLQCFIFSVSDRLLVKAGLLTAPTL